MPQQMATDYGNKARPSDASQGSVPPQASSEKRINKGKA